ncbi:MAG: hypothetical protein U9Q92_04405 [archaeon]|nr:hypothetical protein [archaeon]
MDDSKIIAGSYGLLLNDVKSIIDRGLSKAYKAIDNLKVQTYWQIGERVVREELRHKERADHSRKLVEQDFIKLIGDKKGIYYILK